ncbi:MAG: ATP-binding protein, partial [Dehalococcoidia bacterium]|nr:ATP-binding protein [Dehalococcoidia bacterium]
QMLGLELIADDARFQTLLGASAPALVAAIEECLTSRHPIVRRAVDVQPAAGTAGATHLGVTVSPVLDESGVLQGAICLFSDLTAVVDLEEQLRLKDSLARLGELTAGLAHEFRNGLATIHGYGRLLVPERLPEEYRPYVAALRAETDSLGEIVTNFLNFAKPSNLSLSAVSLERIAERAADEIRREVTERDGEVTLTGKFADIQGDEVLLRQAFSNLCRNAVEACTQPGTPPRIVLHGEVDASRRIASLTVTDNGPGIEPAVRDRMFRPFVTTKAEGTGLGLALVQKIIVTHNGRVAAESSEAGTKIRVTLPIATGEPLP